MNNIGLILFAHGSLNKNVNDRFVDMTNTIYTRHGEKYAGIEPGFLEFAPPSLFDAVAKLASSDVKQIKIFPYFLSLGQHVSRDIPSLVEQCQASYPHIKFTVLPPLSEQIDMISLIGQCI